MTDTDLFGVAPKQRPLKGYAAPPCTGPSDKQCRDCKHFYRKNNKWSKCELVKPTTGTDISMYSPACRRFEQAEH